MFGYAVKAEHLAKNPFAGLKVPKQVDSTRQEFISQDTIKRVVDTAPDAQWRLIIALARFGGLRCPSEVLTLEWQWIDWERERFTVFAPKLEHMEGGGRRVVPLFPELRPYLAEAFDLAEAGAVHVISRYRGSGKNLRTELLRIIKRAGVKPWGRLFHNLRSTRQTELTETFPAHVVASWLGNTEKIASQHYLQITEGHMQRAAKSGAVALQKAVQSAAASVSMDSQKRPEVVGSCDVMRSVASGYQNEQYPRQESNL
jgi:integrase